MCTVSFCILYIIFTASQKSFTITVWFYSRPRYGIEYVYQSSTLKNKYIPAWPFPHRPVLCYPLNGACLTIGTLVLAVLWLGGYQSSGVA